AYKLIAALAQLRDTNPALTSGAMNWLAVDNDVCVFQRSDKNCSVVVAINRNNDQAVEVPLTGLALPAGVHHDYLNALLTGGTLTVATDGTGGQQARALLPR